MIGRLNSLSRDKSCCTNVYLHRYSEAQNTDCKYICCVDPGTVNCAIRVEKRQCGKVDTIIQDIICVKSENQVYARLIQKLQDMIEVLVKVDIVGIEEQMVKSSDNIRVCQTFISFFITNTSATVIEMSPRLKSMGRGIKREQLKRMTTDKALSMLKERGEDDVLTFLLSAGKKDDHADVIVYCEILSQLKYE